jgi:hypothetical protein
MRGLLTMATTMEGKSKFIAIVKKKGPSSPPRSRARNDAVLGMSLRPMRPAVQRARECACACVPVQGDETVSVKERVHV